MKKNLLLALLLTLSMHAIEYSVQIQQKSLQFTPSNMGYIFSNYDLTLGATLPLAERISTQTLVGASTDFFNSFAMRYATIEQMVTLDLMAYNMGLIPAPMQPQISIGAALHLAPTNDVSDGFGTTTRNYDFGYALIGEQGAYIDLIPNMIKLYGAFRYQFSNYLYSAQTFTYHTLGLVVKASYYTK